MGKKDDIVYATKLNMQKNRFLSEVDDLLAQIDSLSDLNHEDQTFVRWKNNVSSLLLQAFGEKSRQYYDFGWISYHDAYSYLNDDGYEWDGFRANRDREFYIKGLQDAKNHLIGIRDAVVKFFVDPSESSVKSTAVSVNKKVFIVHGRDLAMRDQVQLILTRLGLEPIVLADQPNGGTTIIEKIEKNSDVGFAVVLLTPDDQGALSGEKLSARARQNVVLELGYFIGRIGRDHVCTLYVEGVELPGDVDGFGYVNIDDGGKWQFMLVKELRAAGYAVDANLLC